MDKDESKKRKRKRPKDYGGVETTPESANRGESDDPDDTPKEHQKRKKQKKEKGDYSPAKWHTSSSESEYEGVCNPLQVAARNLPDDVTERELMDFFKVQSHQVRIFHLGVNNTHCVISFPSVSEAKEALKLRGQPLRGIALYVKPNGNNRDILRVSGFSNQLTVTAVKKQLRREFKSCGKVLNVFVPGISETGRCLGFGYVYIEDLKQLEPAPKIGGVSCDVENAKPKLCFESDMVGKDIPIEQGSDEDKKIALKRMLLPLNTNLQTSLQKQFSWTKKRPEMLAEAYEQKQHDCWAIALKRGYAAKKKLSGKSGDDLTVDAVHQASGEGINRIRNASTVMKSYVKEMKVHRRPRSADASDHEAFESYLKKLLSVSPVTVTVECLPSFMSFNKTDGKGVYRPTDMDCHLRAFEKFPIHCLLLTGYDVIDGIECWEFQDSQGVKWGTNGFIMMEQHKCLIKSVVELKL